MEFRETLLAAQRNAKQKSSESSYYKARFDPPKKEQRSKDKLSANIQKFLAKKEEEERQKKLEAQKKRDELQALRDPKALRKIQKTLKVIKSANKSVLADAVDTENTAVTLQGPDQPDQDDYGYESQEAAALYQKMMQKYSKIPDQPKFSTSSNTKSKDLNGTRERVRHALQHEDEPVPHKRKRRKNNEDGDVSPPSKYEPEKRKEERSEKPKIRKPAPPPMDFKQLLKIAEQKKREPAEPVVTKKPAEPEPIRLMTKKQRREFEEEMARRQRRQERIEAEKAGTKKVQKDEKPIEKERKPEHSIGRIPKLSDKVSTKHDSPRPIDREKTDKPQREKDKARIDKQKLEREKERVDKERLDKLKAERERIERDIERLNKDRERLEKTKQKLEASSSKSVDRGIDRTKLSSRENSEQSVKSKIDLKSQNTYRLDKNYNEKKSLEHKVNDRRSFEHNTQGKIVPKINREQMPKEKTTKKDINESSPKVNGHKRPDDRKPGPTQSSSKPKNSNTFDFDKHVSTIKNGIKTNGARQYPPGDVKRKHQDDARRMQKRQRVPSDSEYDSEMDDFIDDGDENMDYSKHIKEIFGYDKSKYRDIDDDDDPEMVSSFARQQREEYISKKIGIMEDLEDMRMEAMEKKMKKKKGRRISDD